MRRTKIICTIGPASQSPEQLRALMQAGMNVARLNFSHGAFEDHARVIRHIREQARALRRPVAILQDLPGPKIRIGTFAEGPINLERGHSFTLTCREVAGSQSEVTLPNSEVCASVKVGDSIFLDDGSVQLRVTNRTDTDIATEVLVGGTLTSHKGVTAPGVTLAIDAITPRDIECLQFGIQQGVDWVAASFIRSADDLRCLRAHMDAAGARIPLIAKIEKHEAVNNIDEIIAEADAIMVARGDLGVEVNIWEVPSIQKMIIRRCNRIGKPVITATQMLESMTHNRRPTRAEVTDVVNAILDGTDCIMLSGETAIGLYPVETVEMMNDLAVTAESGIDHASILRRRMADQARTVTDAIGGATVEIAQNLNLAAILTATSSGHTARMVSRYRPKAPIIGVTTKPDTYRRLALSWGVIPIMAPVAETIDDTLHNSFNAARDAGLVQVGDQVVLTGGMPVGQPGHTNLIRVTTVEGA
ncbi:MAG TPA: pyruvate kinase [Armatimonadota bacterium]|jgi:pyruvate kinase